LIELLVVIAIIAVLAAVVAPSVFHNVGDAKVASARSQLEVLSLALAQYRLDNDTFPSTEQGLVALRAVPVAPDANGELPRNWRGPYLSRVIPADPWKRPYVYRAPGIANPTTYDLYTLGRDGRIGGEGEDADITAWGGPVDNTQAVNGASSPVGLPEGE
jgi:general secretion pathway protein G